MIHLPNKQRFPWALGMRVASELIQHLGPGCLRIEAAGSLRRHKETVGDVELLYIPKFNTGADPNDLFRQVTTNLAEQIIETLERRNILERRTNSNGSTMFGEKNKLMRDVESGIPVDLFSTTAECWFNALVCRTGPAESNEAICVAAHKINHTWNPYGPGFTYRPTGEVTPMHSEREVFEFVSLPYLEPEQRNAPVTAHGPGQTQLQSGGR